MAEKGLFAGKRAASYVNLACAVLLLVTAVVYGMEVTAASNFSGAVAGCLVAAAVCAGVFALVPGKVSDLGNLAAVGLVAYALTTFLITSINTLADALAGISMFGSSGSVESVYLLAGLMGVALVVEVASCFMRRDAR